MDQLGRVLLQVSAGDPDRERAVARVDRQRPTSSQREVVLADLIALRQVRIEVVLSIPACRCRCRRTDGSARCQDQLDCATIDRRQRAGEPEADRARVGIRLCAVIRRRAPAEHLRFGLQLAVNFDADDGLVAVADGGHGCGNGHETKFGTARRCRGRIRTGRWPTPPPPTSGAPGRRSMRPRTRPESSPPSAAR